AQQAEGTDGTDVKVHKVKKFVPPVEDFPDVTSVTSETAENQVSPVVPTAPFQTISAVTFPDDTTSAKHRALQKQWLVDPPPQVEAHIQALLACIPGEPRCWTVCIEAVQAYVAAGEPVRHVNFWNRGVQALRGKPLWQVIGQALATRDTPAHAA